LNQFTEEKKSIIEVYTQRKNKDYLYNYLNPQVFLSCQERERYFIKWLKYSQLKPISELKLFEFGCGTGFNFLTFLKLGFNPSNLYGNDLLEERIKGARNMLPGNISLYVGDIFQMDFPDNYFDVVFQSVVFSSILDINFKREIAAKMWQLVKPGGGILWYDFIYNNPQNKDVKGIKLGEVKLLFPYGTIKKWKLTLAPPLGRMITKIHPSFYYLFNFFPFLRTHILCWIKKEN
jgi:SAM-dependent methyltransferase